MMKAFLQRKPLRRQSWWLLGALAVVAACIWPVRTLQKLPAQQAALHSEWMKVQVLAQQAKQLKEQSAAVSSVSPSTTLQALVQQKMAGTATVAIQGDSAVLTLNGLPHAQLAHVLASLRQEALAQIKQLQLREQQGLLNGRMELQLPESR